MDLKVTIKVIKLLGGSINVISKLKKGSKFTIVLDQACDRKDIISKDFENYITLPSSKKRILIVDNSKDELFKISTILSKYNIQISSCFTGDDCIHKINQNELYDLIIIDDELKNDSALNVLNILKENKKFKTKVVVMLDENKEHIKKHYVDDGFADIILKKNLSDEIKSIIEKYI